MGMLRCGRGWRTEFCRHEKNAMRLQIKRHGPSAALGRDARSGCELFRRVLMNDGQRAITVGTESKLGSRVEGVGVHALPDRRGRQHFAGVRVHDDHHLVMAAREEPPMFPVDRQP